MGGVSMVLGYRQFQRRVKVAADARFCEQHDGIMESLSYVFPFLVELLTDFLRRKQNALTKSGSRVRAGDWTVFGTERNLSKAIVEKESRGMSEASLICNRSIALSYELSKDFLNINHCPSSLNMTLMTIPWPLTFTQHQHHPSLRSGSKITKRRIRKWNRQFRRLMLISQW